MAHFAELDENSIVKRVIVVDNSDILDENGIEQEQIGIDYCVNILGGTWIQTSVNANIRKNFAGIDSTYDPIRDAFIWPQSYPSWVLNEDTCQWEPPIEYPSDGKFYYWDEETISWIEPPTE